MTVRYPVNSRALDMISTAFLPSDTSWSCPVMALKKGIAIGIFRIRGSLILIYEYCAMPTIGNNIAIHNNPRIRKNLHEFNATISFVIIF